MSHGPMDRSDPSDKQSYSRTNILPMVKYIACHVSYLENEASMFLVLHDCHYLRRKI